MSEDAPIEQLPPSDFTPLESLAGQVIDARVMLPKWEAQLAEIKRLFAERYPADSAS